MSKVFIPASIKDKATRDTFIAIVKNLGDGNKPTVSDYDPTATTVGTPGQLIYSEATNSIWMFVSNTWVKILGTNGLNNSTVFLYNKSTASSLSKTFSGDFTYTFSTGALTGGTLNGWSTNIPSLSPGENLFVSLATATSNTTTDTIPSSEFSTPEVFGIAAIDGANTALITLYKVTSNNIAPSNPTGNFTYTFDTQALTGGTLNGWSTSAPSVGQGQYSWIITASAFAIGNTDTIAATEFTSPTLTGVPASDGLNNSTVFLYNKSTASSLSKTFSGNFTYTFSTGTLTGGTLNGWTNTIPSLSPGENLFVSLATASANTTTDTISTSEFSTPEVFSIGAIDGANTSIVYLYQVTSSASAPAAPSGTFTYTFSTQALSSGTLNGWSQTTPTVGQGQYLWTISASAFAIGATDTIAASEFTSPTTLSVPAPQGFTGDTVIKGKVYYGNLQSSSPSAPTATSWNLATSSFIGLTSNWSENQPPINATDTNLREWSSFYNVTIDGATNSQTISFTTPSGAIQVTDDIESDNFSAGSAGWRLQRNTGNAEFGSAAIRGTLTAAQIGAGTINSTKLSAGSISALGLTIGTLSSASTGERTVISDTGVKVYDSNNVVRVKLGNLS